MGFQFMAVKLRFSRVGRKHVAQFRLHAIDARKARDGRMIEALGTYQPQHPNISEQFTFKLERCRYWLDCGAQPSDTVAALLRKFGLHHRLLGNSNGNGHANKTLPQVVELPMLSPINWLIDELTSARVSNNVSGRTMAHAIRKSPVLGFEIKRDNNRPILELEMTADIKEGVAHLTAGKPFEELLPLISSRKIKEVFFDVTGVPTETVFDEAARIHSQFTSHASLWEPVVVGPIPVSEDALAQALARAQVRTTGMTFEEYCRDLHEHRSFVGRMKARFFGDKNKLR
jgi:small subunit ribosomal protein S16